VICACVTGISANESAKVNPFVLYNSPARLIVADEVLHLLGFKTQRHFKIGAALRNFLCRTNKQRPTRLTASICPTGSSDMKGYVFR